MKLVDDCIIEILKLLDFNNFIKLLTINKYFNYFNIDNLWQHQYNKLNILFDITANNYKDKCKTYYDLKYLHKNLNYQCRIEDLYKVVKLSRFHHNRPIPNELVILPELKYLCLFRNQYTDIPQSLFQLTKLKRLSLCYNEINIIPKDILRLTSLEILDLNNNNILKIPKWLCKMNLKDLLLHTNQISKIPNDIVNMSLNELDLRNNPILIDKIPQCTYIIKW